MSRQQQEIVIIDTDDGNDSDVEYIGSKANHDCVIVYEKPRSVQTPAASLATTTTNTNTTSNSADNHLQNLNTNNTGSNAIPVIVAPQSPPALALSCCVCYENLSKTKDKFLSTLCGHIYCDECIGKIMASTKNCAVCRKKLTKKQYHRIFLS